jgi:hypothetical protein
MEVNIICENDNPQKPVAIKISKGAGITSEGYLVETDLTFLARFQSYTDPAGYDMFWTSSGNNKTQIPLFELLPDTCEEIITRSQLPVTSLIKDNPVILKNKVILAYVEIYDEAQRACFSDSCDGKGMKRFFTVRYLLIDSDDAEKFIRSKYSINSDTTLDEFFNIKFSLPELYIKSIHLSGITGIDELNNKYQDAINEAIPLLADALKMAFEVSRNWLNSTNPFTRINDDLSSIAQNNTDFSQYVYDFIIDLINAYREFKTVAFELYTKCCPTYDLFQMHLMLGETHKPASCKPSVFRNYYLQPPVYNLQSGLINKCRLLFKRMAFMVKNFKIPAPFEKNTTLKITPSHLRHIALSETAIPYYYSVINDSENLYEYWNYNLAEKCQSYYQLSYHADDYPDKSDFAVNPLKYNNSFYNFLRIEGHLGLPLDTVCEEIDKIRTDANLPFSLITLCINEIYQDKDFNNDFNDDFKTNPDDFNSSMKFSGFLKAHPGLEHVAGVEKGGTFILVFEETLADEEKKKAMIVADFSLPYFVQAEKTYNDYNDDFNNDFNIVNN